MSTYKYNLDDVKPEYGAAAKEIKRFAISLLNERSTLLTEGERSKLNRIIPEPEKAGIEKIQNAIDLVNRTVYKRVNA